MIDITRAEILRYGDGKTITVYDAFDEPGLKFIVPTPRFLRRDIAGTTQPVFTLIEYTVEGGDRRGTLTFSVELAVPQDALDAVKAKFPDARFGQLSWQEAEVVLKFRVLPNEEEKLFVASPSLAGSNQASYVLALESAAEVDFMKANFGPGAADVSQLLLTYNVTTLTELRAVDATVSFNATRALEYERTLEVRKNIWGTVTDRKETVRQNLKASDAGTTKISLHIPNPSDEFRQRVDNWAFRTLETLVQRAVDEATVRLGPGSSGMMSAIYVASFDQSFEQDQVIEWEISPNALLPAATIRDNFDAHFQKVDFRKLVTTFTVLGDLKEAEIERVELQVDYFDVGDTNVFEPDGEMTFTFEADGRQDSEGVFDPNYSYVYTVFFKGGGFFKVDAPINTAQTEVALSLADLGFVSVVFDGSNLDFIKFDQVMVGFFFQPPAGLPAVNEIKILSQASQNVRFRSQFRLRATDFAFNYQLVFRLKDGTLYRISPVSESGALARRTVLLVDPLQTSKYTLAVNNVESFPAITRGLLTGTYDDEVNGFHTQKLLNFTTDGDEYTQEKVTIRAVVNPNATYLRLNGRLLLEGGVLPINDLYLSGQDTFLLLNSDMRPFTVKFDPFQVDWQGGVKRVQVDVFNAVPLGTAVALSLDEFERGLFSKSITLAAVQNSEGGIDPQLATPAQYFSFDFGFDVQPTYVYMLTYFHAETGPTFSAETTASRGTVTLPKDGDTNVRTLHIVRENLAVETAAVEAA